MLRTVKICVIIPAYNAEKHLSDVINNIRASFSGTVIVVDDGSSDGTKVVAENAGTIVLSHRQNLGKGAALKTGYGYAIRCNCSAVITIDSDGQHDPVIIPLLIDAYQRGDKKIIIGSRMHETGTMPFHRKLSNKITSGMISMRINRRVSDSQSGFRLIDVDVLKRIKLSTSHFDTESELLLKAGLHGYHISEIPIASKYSDESSSVRHFLDTWRFVKLYFTSMAW
ncbi:MAG: glycosyltransferase family 2 protein [candidate division KSB1 bacterium]|jgi:glycosyltransferase involved in cell wall biosynthesis|nr:glycosyltransferase family 2 protein [candidate division KSB1 bacterium]